jgi:hypothetical protein
MQMMEDFYRGELNLKRINYGTIVLLPKIQEVMNIKQYRPICLLNVINKIFTNVLSIRLMEVAKNVISKTQKTFIKGRYIMEGVLVLHEVVHEMKRKKIRGIILKLDFEKAYDKVNCEFMKEVLTQKRFPSKWIEWIMQSIEGGKVSINVNNEQGKYFKTYKGLRQGDPLSLLLFNLVVDALAAMLDAAKKKGEDPGVSSTSDTRKANTTTVCR